MGELKLVVASAAEKNDGVVGNPLSAVAEILARTTRVRVYHSSIPGQLARKRRDRPPVLADHHGTDALNQLRAALMLRPDTAVAALMCRPDLWLELLGHDNARLTTIGLLHSGWLRYEPYGDLQLHERTRIVHWLNRWAPEAAATIAGGVALIDRP